MTDKNSLPIGILDSGVGGLTAVVPMQQMLQNESVLYLGDSLRMPYGNKEPREIICLANKLIAFLEQKGVKAILLACNTISSYISQLKSGVKLFSIIEAGAYAVCENVNADSVGLIATCATTDSGMYEKHIKKLLPRINIISSSSATLPKIIDSHLENKTLLREHIRQIIDPIIKRDDTITDIILGCSHFPIIKKEIGELYPAINFIDPAYKQVEMLQSFLAENGLCNAGGGSLKLYTTAETYEYAAAIKRLHLEIDSLIKVVLE